MNKNTRVYISEELANVPSLCIDLIEGSVRKELEMVNSEIDHLLRIGRHDKNIKPEVIVWHIDQARRRLFRLDARMQDVYAVASQYMTYTAQQDSEGTNLDEEGLKAVQEELRQKIYEVGGLDDEKESENTEQ